MKLMLRPEWRLYPLSSFLGVLDLKTGVTVALLFALLNKVAGVYGLIAVLTGAGGSFAQLSLYIYSVVALIALGWGLRAVKEEDPRHTLYFAHLFFADHIFSTSWTVFFAVMWWFYTPHDGKRQANSAAQEAMMKGAIGVNQSMTDEEREEAAMLIWNQEKGTAAAVIMVSWMFKIYFALLLYSYASHLRKGSYRSLPHSRSISTSNPSNMYTSALPDEEDEEVEDFYRIPLRTPQSQGHNRNGSLSSLPESNNTRRTDRPKSTLGKSAPIRPLSRNDDHGNSDVLFDEEEFGSSSRAHSRFGTEESSTSASNS